MITTIKVSQETKERLMSLDLAEKGKTFDVIINDLITSYRKMDKKHKKDLKKWDQSMKFHEKEVEKCNREVMRYKKQKKIWDNLLKWAKSKGFKS